MFEEDPLSEQLLDACHSGNIEAVTEMIPYVDRMDYAHRALDIAAEKGDVELLELLLPHIESENEHFYPLQRAAAAGHLDAIECILEHCADPDLNSVLACAAEHGHVYVVVNLLGRADPSACDHRAFLDAAANGHADVVECLLQDPRVDPTADDQWAIKIAAERGHLAVVERLLADTRVNPFEDDQPMQRAMRNGHPHVVHALREWMLM